MKAKIKKFDELTAVELAEFIDRYTLQIVKGGYAWRDSWEVNRPAPCGHYQECAEATVAYGKTAGQALEEAYNRLNK